ncbi:hypothetical protein D9M69_655550 [compost metagenome]
MAGREVRALAAEHHGVHRVVARGVVEGGHELVQHLLALGVALGVAGQQDAAHGAVVFDFEGVVRHRVSPGLCLVWVLSEGSLDFEIPASQTLIPIFPTIWTNPERPPAPRACGAPCSCCACWPSTTRKASSSPR